MKNFARGWPSTSAYPSRDPSFVVQRIRVPFVDSFADVKLYEGRGEEENIRRRRFSHPGFLRGSRQRKICFFFFFAEKFPRQKRTSASYRFGNTFVSNNNTLQRVLARSSFERKIDNQIFERVRSQLSNFFFFKRGLTSFPPRGRSYYSRSPLFHSVNYENNKTRETIRVIN